MKGYQVLLVIGALVLGINKTYATMSKDRAALLVKHLDLMRELKTTIADKNRTHHESSQSQEYISATDAFLSFPELKCMVDQTWEEFFIKHIDLVNTIMERERAHAEKYYVFYHAQDKRFRIFQDFLRQVFEYVHMSQELKSFAFLRFWTDMLDSVDANTFIDGNEKKYSEHNWDDHIPDIAKQLLSVNLSLFGNCNKIDAWECTFDYFLNSRSVMFAKADTQEIFDNIFACFGFNKKYIDQLSQLNKLIETQEGSLFQIFVPWQIVDRCAYLSYPGGVPYSKALLECEFNTQLKRYIAISPILSKYRISRSYVDQIKNDPKVDEQEVKNRISQVAYTLDGLQARLIFSKDMLLNPDSGIEIYRYTTISDEAMVRYTEQLKKITHQIFVDWLQDLHACDNIEGTKLDSLYRTIKISDT